MLELVISDDIPKSECDKPLPWGEASNKLLPSLDQFFFWLLMYNQAYAVTSFWSQCDDIHRAAKLLGGCHFLVG